MTKLRLEVEEDYPFKVIGICCADEGYRFCGNVNRALEINLGYHGEIKADNRSGRSHHAIWRHHDSTKWTLDVVWNRTAEGAMIPVFKHFDYLLRVESHSGNPTESLLIALRNISSVASCFQVDPVPKPARYYLDFD
jgi:hypothetical protein